MSSLKGLEGIESENRSNRDLEVQVSYVCGKLLREQCAAAYPTRKVLIVVK